MCHVCVNTVCVNRVLGNIGKGQPALFPRCFCVSVYVCVYQKVENVIFGLAMFAEGQSGPVPKTSRLSQLNLGKYAIHASTHKYQDRQTHTHTVQQIMHMMQTNKQESRFSFPVSLCISLSQPNTVTQTRLQTANLHLSWSGNRLPLQRSVHDSGERPRA